MLLFFLVVNETYNGAAAGCKPLLILPDTTDVDAHGLTHLTLLSIN